jgi:hypothetical protein
MENQQSQPRVGIGVMILKDGKVLLGTRKGSHGAGELAFPGGHLDYMESFDGKERCGLNVQRVYGEAPVSKLALVKREFRASIEKETNPFDSYLLDRPVLLQAGLRSVPRSPSSPTGVRSDSRNKVCQEGCRPDLGQLSQNCPFDQ